MLELYVSERPAEESKLGVRSEDLIGKDLAKDVNMELF
jgi:hypothetical protein